MINQIKQDEKYNIFIENLQFLLAYFYAFF